MQRHLKLVLILVFSLFLTVQMSRAAGVTIITHGFNDDATNGWIISMANAVSNRVVANGGSGLSIIPMFVKPPTTLGGPLSVTNGPVIGSTPLQSDTGEIIVELDWSQYAGSLNLSLNFLTEGTNTTTIAEAVVSSLLNSSIVGRPLVEMPIHLIGHSRGGSLVCEIARELGQQGIWVDQVTTLDPHPLNANGDQDSYYTAGILNVTDAPVAEYGNVIFADNYYETTFAPIDPITYTTYPIQGFAVSGATNAGPLIFDVGNGADQLGCWLTISLYRIADQHDDVHLWYHGTIDTSSQAGDGPITILFDWYSNNPQWPRTQSGYYWSRLGGGDFARPAAGLAQVFGGMASRVAVDNPVPNASAWNDVMIDGITQDTTIAQGNALPVNFWWEDRKGDATVKIGFDTDANPYNGTNGAPPFSLATASMTSSHWGASVSTSSLIPGQTYRVYAEISNGTHTRYYYAPGKIIVVSPTPQPTLSSASVSPSSGTTADTYTYSVNYFDPSGTAPISEQVFIDNSPFTMTLKAGSSANGTYSFMKGNFTIGVHTYQIFFKSGGGNWIQLPLTNGPTVSSPSSGGTEIVTVQQNYGGDVIPVPSPTARYSIGDQLWFTAIPWFGWEVDYWQQRWASDWMPADAVSGNSAMIQVRGDNIVACVFERQDPNQRILNISSIGPGSVNPAPGSYSYALNSQVTNTATPSQNSAFVGWSLNGVNVGSNTTTVVTMNGDLDQNLVASFTSTNLIQYTNDAPDIADTYIYEDAPTAMGRDVGSDSDLWVWYPQSGHIGDSLLKFDLSGIPSNAIISSVSLRLWCIQYPNTCASLEVQKVLQNWPESNCNFVPQRTYTLWDTEPRYSQTGWIEIALSGLHSEWINWVQNEWLQPNQNHGLLIRIVQYWITAGRQTFYNNGPWRFSSRENSDSTKSPVLRVIYLAPKPIPTIATDQTNISIQIVEGQVPANQTLLIHNSGQGILNYAVSNNAPWLNFSGEITGTSSNESHQVTLNFNTASLAATNYQATITITDTNADHSPYTVPVFLTVLGPTISVSTTNISAATLRGSDAAPTTIEIWNGGFATLSFSLVETSAWLNVTPTSETSTGDVQQITVQFASDSLVPGIYQDTLIVTNTTGETPSVSIPVTLTVFDKVVTPTFTPGGNTVCLTNVSVSISCATPGATIHYTLDGSPTTESSPAFSAPILLTNTTILRAAAWEAGMLPSDEQIATFEMLPPTITGQPQNQTVAPGNTATFTVITYGTQPFQYQWRKNGTNVANGGTISGATTAMLTINNVQTNNAGNYTVLVTNNLGSVTSSPPAILVLDGQKPTNQIVLPTSGLRVSNAVYAITGKAGDNLAVSNVYYQLDNGVWNTPITTNNWTNWTAQVTLVPGTNTIQAYAVDTAGNFSTTNKASLVYILSAPLTVSTNGNGTISPNYNGALLQIGANYSMTATASAGFGFTGWTGSSTTNGATLKFIMASNLTFTANFADTARPTNGISSPTANQHWSNAVFTVSGKARDNVAVANVFYSLNGSGWAPAVTANNWSNWTAQVTLVPGTNTIQAYAVDTVGNFSTTNKASLVYILSAVLTVNTNGNGTISPNYNGALLQIGANYSMTAKAATGFGFTGWTGSSTTNGATLKFVMASNLTFTANFVDTARPTNGISSPTANQHWSNEVFTVSGKARDNVAVANVFYSLNGSAWTAASTANNWTNWTAGVALVPGTNTIQAYAVDTVGNFSTTNKASLVYILSAPLTVSTNGNGTISPNYNGALLQIGQNYSMTATASAGFGFTGWTGSSTTNGATIKFLMASDLTFTANFADTAKPTNGISSPTANQHWSNAVFTVSGKARDNVAVANVFYSLNGSGWANASTPNNWSNWTAQVTLVPGTNTIQAYAVDTVGNFSTTNKASLVYILSAPLTVSTNGNGTISPNYNGALLQIGANYSMTATASAGFGFTGWTGSSTTNGATLKFIMASNLTFTANFVDVAKPVLTITAPTANQHWSNAVFTVSGTARDNVAVANVFYSLNGSGWAPAVTANNWSNWTAQVTLVPGTNTIQACAVDTVGNFSTTNKASLVYILSAPLTVSTNGRGSISPNYNGALLQIGSTYTMTATASTGFGFTGWTGSSTTNGATLKFTMASNLTFTANFVDTNRPTVSITNLASGQRVSNAVFTVKGTASDNVQVSNVWYQLNVMAWSNALTANGWTNWTAQVTLVPGTNTIQAYAVDTAGNFSTTNKASLVYILSAPLTVSINGNGTISPNYNGALLQIGSTYTMTATASAGFGFTGWTGSSTTNGATLKFVMASNLTFTANFSPIVSCTYALSATSTNVAAGTASGSFNVTAASGCAWTATSGSSWIHTSSAGTGSGTVSYTVDANTATNSRTGTITISGHTFTVTQAAHTDVQDPPIKLFGAGASPWINDIMEDSSNNILVAGTQDEDQSVVVLKLDSAGTMAWNKYFPAGTSIATHNIFEVLPPSSGYLVTGGIDSNLGVLFKMPLDTAGNQSTASYFDCNDIFIESNDSVMLQDGTIIFVGFTQFKDNGNTFIPYGNALITGINSSGTQYFRSDYSYAEGYSTTFNSVIALSGGGFAAAGSANLYDDGSGYGGPYNAILVKTDSLGSVIWTKNYGYITDDLGNGGIIDLIQTSDNGYAMLAWLGYNYDMYVIKTDSSGNSTSAFNAATGDSCYRGRKFVQSGDNGFVIVGQGSGCHGAVVKMSAAGAKVWEYNTDYNPTAIVKSASGGYLIAGDAYVDLGVYKIFVFKLDDLGKRVW